MTYRYSVISQTWIFGTSTLSKNSLTFQAQPMNAHAIGVGFCAEFEMLR